MARAMGGDRGRDDEAWLARWAVIAGAMTRHGSRDGWSSRRTRSVIAGAMRRHRALQVWSSRSTRSVIAGAMRRHRALQVWSSRSTRSGVAVVKVGRAARVGRPGPVRDPGYAAEEARGRRIASRGGRLAEAARRGRQRIYAERNASLTCRIARATSRGRFKLRE